MASIANAKFSTLLMTQLTLAQKNILTSLGICAFGLLSVWALPETIAFRHIFLGFGFILGLAFLWPYSNLLRSNNAWPLWALLSLYVWLVMHALLFARQPSIQLLELRSIWGRSLLALPLGLAIGIFLSLGNQAKISGGVQARLKSFLFAGFISTFIVFICHYFYQSYLAGTWLGMQALPWWSIPYREKPPFVVATALLLPMCCALLLRAFQGKESLWWGAIAISAISLSVASNYLANTKNGMAILVICITSYALYGAIHLVAGWAKKSFTKTFISFILAASLLTGVAWGVKLHIESNSAWSQLIANVKIGLDIDHQQYWKNRNVYSSHPINQNGVAVDISTYERTAWFTAGLRLLTDRPQGFGLVHHSFGWMALEKWPDFYQPIGTLRGMTHSGWMDLALGIGIPGLLLILIPLATSWYRSLTMESFWGAYTSWAIPIFTLTYLTTEVTGAHHFIELLMFMTAFFIGITLNASPNLSRSLEQSTGPNYL